MLARANFDQNAGADFAVAHARFFRLLGGLPYPLSHRLLLSGAWLETWLRYPLSTLNLRDQIAETFSQLDPDGRRFGLTRSVRDGFTGNLLYHQVCDLVTLLTYLEKPGFRRALTVENQDTLLQERARGPGAIVVGFRIGAYPVLPWPLASLGFPVSMIVGNPELVRMGRGLGREFVPSLAERIRFFSARDPLVLTRCLEDLASGGIVATLLELSPIEYAKTVEVRFLDWTIRVPYGIAYLAAMTGRSMVPAFLAREAGPRFKLCFGEPLPAPARDRASIFESTQQLYRVLEKQVLMYPDQWIGWTLLSSHMNIEELRPLASSAPPIS